MCARPQIDSLTICADCRTRASRAPRVACAVLPDSDGFDRMVRTFKRGAVRRLSSELADLTLSRWSAGQLDLPAVDQLDLITWVPHATSRAAQRGCHAPELYARSLGKRLGLPCQPLLRRCIEAPQRGRNIAGRREHARQSFELAQLPAGSLPGAGCQVLVVDDVRTTGATLAICCELVQTLDLIPHQLAVVAVPRHTKKRASPDI
ncbi:MAG: hypothetical protein H7123_00105 [Thermoleophilia bacterium]|nr:hypothetical protein [Thermoleophilia bacterium]